MAVGGEQRVRCDAVVVGAGPGGSAAAYWLARTGADVVLVDKAHFPRNKPCGDGLTPRAVDLLEVMGLAEFVHTRGRPFTGVRVSNYDAHPTPYTLHANGKGQPRRGLVIPRRELDDTLCQHAVRAGARFLSGFSVVEPLWRRGRAAGLRGHNSTHPLIIEAQLIIVATGANRTLMQALGLVDEVQPKALAMRGYVTGLQGLDETLEIYLERELLPGYAWVFPTGVETANVGVGITLDGATTTEGNRELRAAFNRLLESHRLAGGKLLGRPQGYPLRTDFPTIPTHADCVLVIGETAGLVDPLTGEGIALALESGQLAAEVAGEALSSGDLSSRQLNTYTDVLRERHAGYFESARELMARLEHPQVLDAFIQYARTDSRIREALRLAILDERPRDSITLLGEVLHSDDGLALARALFTLNAYKPLLDRCRDYMLAQVSRDAPSPTIVELVGRGKMLRALLVFLGCQAAGGDPLQVLAGAGSIELVHAASLIHDDVMDDAVLRRGLPAVHTTLGEARAIVCGDYLIAKAFRLLAESRIMNPAANVVDAFIVGAESGIRACAGQFQDVGTWLEETLTEENYYRVIANKTAAAIAGALEAGAVLAGGGPPLLEALSRYGECVGLAFQIKDDLLDLSTVASNGCSIDRKVSLPLIHAFQHGDENGRAIIRRFLNRQAVPGHQMADVLETNGSLAYAEAAAGALVEEAVQLAKAISQIQEVLEAFARYTILRNQ